jgi:hexosaminidase
VTNYVQEPIPASLTFDKGGKKESIYISAERRFEQYKSIEDVPTDRLSPIIPTPQKIIYGKVNFTLKSGIQILHDAGLENEANNLAETLNQVLQSPAVIGLTKDDENYNIYLKLDTINSFSSQESYKLQIVEKIVEITAPSPTGIFYGIQSLKALIPAGFYKVPADQIILPSLSISDSPRYAYRGQHLDVGRNFQPVESIKKIIRLMAFYKLNKLHFHLTDDEGWRLEIPGLPELTDVGARRGLSATGAPMLPPAYGSGGIADAQISAGTGYYSRSQFIDILRLAKQHHIEVIPEINGPGHARAAIIAMKARYEKLMRDGKEADARTYLLSDLNDVSEYSSAQNYRDNVICVCQEYTYTFLEKVIAEVFAKYEEADAP